MVILYHLNAEQQRNDVAPANKPGDCDDQNHGKGGVDVRAFRFLAHVGTRIIACPSATGWHQLCCHLSGYYKRRPSQDVFDHDETMQA